MAKGSVLFSAMDKTDIVSTDVSSRQDAYHHPGHIKRLISYYRKPWDAIIPYRQKHFDTGYLIGSILAPFV